MEIPAEMSGPRRTGLPGWRAWRDLMRDGALRDDPDPDGTAAALVRHWHQHFAVAVDGPLEQAPTGRERLPQLVDAWLELARRSEPVRTYVARVGGARAAAESTRQDAVLLGLLAEDLSLLGVREPDVGAAVLLREIRCAAGEEDRAGRVLPDLRAAALRAAGVQVRRSPLARRRALLGRRSARVAVA